MSRLTTFFFLQFIIFLPVFATANSTSDSKNTEQRLLLPHNKPLIQQLYKPILTKKVFITMSDRALSDDTTRMLDDVVKTLRHINDHYIVEITTSKSSRDMEPVSERKATGLILNYLSCHHNIPLAHLFIGNIFSPAFIASAVHTPNNVAEVTIRIFTRKTVRNIENPNSFLDNQKTHTVIKGGAL